MVLWNEGKRKAVGNYLRNIAKRQAKIHPLTKELTEKEGFETYSALIDVAMGEFRGAAQLHYRGDFALSTKEKGKERFEKLAWMLGIDLTGDADFKKLLTTADHFQQTGEITLPVSRVPEALPDDFKPLYKEPAVAASTPEVVAGTAEVTATTPEVAAGVVSGSLEPLGEVTINRIANKRRDYRLSSIVEADDPAAIAAEKAARARMGGGSGGGGNTRR